MADRWDVELNGQLNDIWSLILGIPAPVVQIRFRQDRAEWSPGFLGRIEEYRAAAKEVDAIAIRLERQDLIIRMLEARIFVSHQFNADHLIA